MVHSQKTSHYPLILVFLIFSMLLNCMGIMILQFADQKISFQGLGFLESFKDLPIAIASLFAVRYINRFGSKYALLFTVGFVAICCLSVPFIGRFWIMKIWFVLIGLSFAVGKISTFSLLRSNYGKKQLAQVMNEVEASFMLGIFLVNMGFGWLLGSSFKEYWMFGFWMIALISILTFILLWRMPYKEIEETRETQKSNAWIDFLTHIDRRTVVFLLIMLLIVFVEQCLNSWLPTFYKGHFKVSSQFALQSTAFLALFSFVGRYLTSKLIHRFSWYKYVWSCLLLLGLMLVTMYLFVNFSPQHNLFLIYLIPAIGLFLAPLYPILNAQMLLHYESKRVNNLISALVVFSSLGSALGSIYISWAFHFDLTFLYPVFILVPILLLGLLLVIFKISLQGK